MDQTEKIIITALMENCRISIRKIAHRLGRTSTGIQKRITKLKQQGIISRGYVLLSRAMLNTEFCYSEIITDATENDEGFIDHLGSDPCVIAVARLGPRRLFVGGEVVGGLGMSKFSQHLRSFKMIRQVEMRFVYPVLPSPLPNSHKYVTLGNKVLFTESQLRVLRHLLPDARTPATEIAKRLQMTPRRVQQIITELQQNGALHFTILTCFSAASLIPFWMHIDFDEDNTTAQQVIHWFQDYYPLEYWNTWHYTDQAHLMLFGVTKDIQSLQSITNTTKNAPFTTKVESVVIHPQTHFVGPGYLQLAKLLGIETANQRVEYYTSSLNQWY